MNLFGAYSQTTGNAKAPQTSDLLSGRLQPFIDCARRCQNDICFRFDLFALDSGDNAAISKMRTTHRPALMTPTLYNCVPETSNLFIEWDAASESNKTSLYLSIGWWLFFQHLTLLQVRRNAVALWMAHSPTSNEIQWHKTKPCCQGCLW